MEDAAIQFFRTGKLPQEWPGIDMPEYYRVVDDETGSLVFNVFDDFYLFLKSTFRKLGIELDKVETLDDLAELEREYFNEIESAIIRRQHMSKSKDLDEAYSQALFGHDRDEAARLLKLIFERDRKGLKVI
jgi:hypothetical protein